jgi:hypothetical protein
MSRNNCLNTNTRSLPSLFIHHGSQHHFEAESPTKLHQKMIAPNSTKTASNSSNKSLEASCIIAPCHRDPTIPVALNELAGRQSKATESLMKQCKPFLDYMATHPDAKIRYYASDMILNVHSDALYLSAPNARSRASGYFFLRSLPKPNMPIKLKGAINVICSPLRFVAASAAEAELGALFIIMQKRQRY